MQPDPDDRDRLHYTLTGLVWTEAQRRAYHTDAQFHQQVHVLSEMLWVWIEAIRVQCEEGAIERERQKQILMTTDPRRSFMP